MCTHLSRHGAEHMYTHVCVTTRLLVELPSFFLLLLSQDDTNNDTLKSTPNIFLK